ncbi:Disintegrin and metalloproteinase domain-containing protein 29 [Holothuria leucospilota]|uniref:Disintegrin and metalloproteinase domain-containing protein 29 n=1 Tax=Holothuria leucospilota TaxID=206669 RepID=A0A9Q0Y9I0_HOLLE|nr:Disintegrin and metalloproteinase domain-containing protein 29 [Holothuria leucospilota]
MAARQSNQTAEEALDVYFRLEAEDHQRQRDDLSDSSDDEAVYFRRSRPKEPALQDSAFLGDSDSEPEDHGELAQPLPPQPQRQQPPQQQPPQQQPPQQQPPQQQPAQEQPPQPPKRPRGRPRNIQPETQPPPRRPQTPKPVLDANQQRAFNARCADRETQFRAFRALRFPTPAQVEGYESLLVEDEIDRHRCDGMWK